MPTSDRLILGLLQLPYKVRCSIVLLALLCSVVLFALGYPSQFNGSVFAIPLALTAWILYKREIVLVSLGILLTLVTVNSINQHTLLWSHAIFSIFLIGTVALFAEICVIAYLRRALETAQRAHRKAKQAEEQLAIVYKRQQELNQLKDQFILNVNHELRTPLTQVYGYLELLNSSFESLQLDGPPALFLTRALQGCEELSLLINNILSVSAENNMKLSPHIEELAVATVTQEVLDHFDPRTLTAYQIELDIPNSLTVLADAQFFRQVLRNILSNAFKYTPPARPIIIRAAVEESVSLVTSEDTGHVCISIKDSGPGIPCGELSLLFEKFVRLHRDLTGSIRGCGLGLYISKQLVEAMNGRIWVESTGQEGEGCCFSFTLPTPRAQSANKLEISLCAQLA